MPNYNKNLHSVHIKAVNFLELGSNLLSLYRNLYLPHKTQRHFRPNSLLYIGILLLSQLGIHDENAYELSPHTKSVLLYKHLLSTNQNHRENRAMYIQY